MPCAGCLHQRLLCVEKTNARQNESKKTECSPKRFARSILARERTYGAPRVHAELKAKGWAVGRKRVARLMRAGGLARASAAAKRPRPPDGIPISARHLIWSNAISVPTGPDRLWVADITYVPTWAGFLFLAVVMDAWSRRVVGWAMATHLRTELVLDALQMAIDQRQPRKSSTTQTRAASTPLWPSENAAPRPVCAPPWDRSAIAMTMHCARASSPPWNANCWTARASTPADARLGVFQFIEGWYNPHRRHSALEYLSPIRYELAHTHLMVSPSS